MIGGGSMGAALLSVSFTCRKAHWKTSRAAVQWWSPLQGRWGCIRRGRRRWWPCCEWQWAERLTYTALLDEVQTIQMLTVPEKKHCFVFQSVLVSCFTSKTILVLSHLCLFTGQIIQLCYINEILLTCKLMVVQDININRIRRGKRSRIQSKSLFPVLWESKILRNTPFFS